MQIASINLSALSIDRWNANRNKDACLKPEEEKEDDDDDEAEKSGKTGIILPSKDEANEPNEEEEESVDDLDKEEECNGNAAPSSTFPSKFSPLPLEIPSCSEDEDEKRLMTLAMTAHDLFPPPPPAHNTLSEESPS
ncbi:hypothetical protein FRC15_007548 [Serendipita sp. 397]|nr:hypothetical protein FRC15_007548 [Serendipita sp. 397]